MEIFNYNTIKTNPRIRIIGGTREDRNGLVSTFIHRYHTPNSHSIVFCPIFRDADFYNLHHKIETTSFFNEGTAIKYMMNKGIFVIDECYESIWKNSYTVKKILTDRSKPIVITSEKCLSEESFLKSKFDYIFILDNNPKVQEVYKLPHNEKSIVVDNIINKQFAMNNQNNFVNIGSLNIHNLKSGSTYLIIGANASGKTTICKKIVKSFGYPNFKDSLVSFNYNSEYSYADLDINHGSFNNTQKINKHLNNKRGCIIFENNMLSDHSLKVIKEYDGPKDIIVVAHFMPSNIDFNLFDYIIITKNVWTYNNPIFSLLHQKYPTYYTLKNAIEQNTVAYNCVIIDNTVVPNLYHLDTTMQFETDFDLTTSDDSMSSLSVSTMELDSYDYIDTDELELDSIDTSEDIEYSEDDEAQIHHCKRFTVEEPVIHMIEYSNAPEVQQAVIIDTNLVVNNEYVDEVECNVAGNQNDNEDETSSCIIL